MQRNPGYAATHGDCSLAQKKVEVRGVTRCTRPSVLHHVLRGNAWKPCPRPEYAATPEDAATTAKHAASF